ncbi:hypothetical protein PILCRDRAFT_4198 [Piloderma croceum F 1598]|uniref:Protein kinase domain-containing protein n=1 Tax=Piloderma croceum (strain F 1598) TaxID=765440 RepID=A0A0C3G8H3_PILCF|nr:hypothetical protein PILCRDRAFT_4198 [Piloderma croceum F 1598]
MLQVTPVFLSLSGAFQPKGILHVENQQFAGFGGDSNLYKANLTFSNQSKPLPIMAKAFRILPNDQESNDQLSNIVDMLQERESAIGHAHEHISPIWSASVAMAGHTVPAIATPYYCNGNINNYVRLHPTADRLDLVRQTASALAHIHSKDVVHGDICPENICIADDGTVQVTDIAVDTLVCQANHRNSLCVPSNWMYKPPEELEWGYRTTQTDVYSFAVTIYFVYTSKPPFASKAHFYGKGIVQIVNHGHDGIFRELKPDAMCNELWKVVRMCLAKDPSQRPSMAEVDKMLAMVRENKHPLTLASPVPPPTSRPALTSEVYVPVLLASLRFISPIRSCTPALKSFSSREAIAGVGGNATHMIAQHKPLPTSTDDPNRRRPQHSNSFGLTSPSKQPHQRADELPRRRIPSACGGRVGTRKAKHSAVYFLPAIASRCNTTQLGITSTNALIDAVRLFAERVLEDLRDPILQIDAIRFF